MLRIALALAVGVLLGHAFPLFKEWAMPLAAFLAFLYLLTFWIPSNWRGSASGFIGHLLMVSIGILLYLGNIALNDEQHFATRSEVEAYIGVIDDEVIPKANSYSTIVKVKYVKTDGIWEPSSGKVLAYLPKQCDSPRYGDWLLVDQMPDEVEGPKNPGEFNYKRYLAFRSVYHQQFLGLDSWRILQHAPESSVWEWAFGARDFLSSMLSKELGNGEEYAVASMLIVGIRQAIPQELMEAYSSAGAMHVLAVSGMHVGLIFALIEMLFGRFARRFSLTSLFYPLCILGIWGFGFLTAFSPSVLRAVVMFTFIIVGKWLNRKASLYNAMGFAVFFILIFAPMMLFDVGFQLSFVAVWGIAYLNPLIKSWFSPQNVILRATWEVTSVCISAQLATLPLCLVYFNQYPVYALVSNLWVVPLGTFILYVGIFFFLGSSIAWWKALIGGLLKWCVWLLNKSMLVVANLPFAIFRVPSFTWWEALLLAFVIGSLMLLFHLRKAAYLKYAIIFAFVLTCSRLYFMMERERHKKLVFYSVKKETCFAVITGRHAAIWAEEDLFKERVSLKRKVIDPLVRQGCTQIEEHSIPQQNFLMELEGNGVLFLNDNLVKDKKEAFQELDYVYLTNRCRKIADFVPSNTVKEIILPKQSSWMYLNAWNLQEKGALEVKL